MVSPQLRDNQRGIALGPLFAVHNSLSIAVRVLQKIFEVRLGLRGCKKKKIVTWIALAVAFMQKVTRDRFADHEPNTQTVFGYGKQER